MNEIVEACYICEKRQKQADFAKKQNSANK